MKLALARGVGRHQHPGLESQDSQHMISQPRGSFPESLTPKVRQKLGRTIFF